MKSYIDVSFTLEEDLSQWSEEEKDKIIKYVDESKDFFIKEFDERFADYKGNIKNLNVTITFEERI